MATYDSDKFPLEQLRAPHKRADVELHGVDQAVPSYQGHVFLNQPDAGPDTPLDSENGYLGSFSIFGKVECWGEDEGHCAAPAGRKFDGRQPPQRYAKVRVRTPDGLLARLAGAVEGDEATLNVVAVLPDGDAYQDRKPEEALRFERLAIVTYD